MLIACKYAMHKIIQQLQEVQNQSFELENNLSKSQELVHQNEENNKEFSNVSL